jgi:hypothetical protein
MKKAHASSAKPTAYACKLYLKQFAEAACLATAKPDTSNCAPQAASRQSLSAICVSRPAVSVRSRQTSARPRTIDRFRCVFDTSQTARADPSYRGETPCASFSAKAGTRHERGFRHWSCSVSSSHPLAHASVALPLHFLHRNSNFPNHSFRCGMRGCSRGRSFRAGRTA